MTILATIVLLGVLIFVHELGHFWAAKAVGIGVERFSIGLGPRIWGYTRGETEYVLSAIPLGGYVKMQGMDDEVMEHLEGGANPRRRKSRAGDFDHKSVLARAFVISAGVIMNMLFAFALYSVTAGIWGIPEVATTRVMSVEESLLSPETEALASITPGAVVEKAGDVVPETWTDLERVFLEGPAGSLAVVTSGPADTFRIVVPAGEADRLDLSRALQFWIDPLVGRIESGGPADGAIESGDLITSVAGVPVRSWADMTREIAARPGERADIGLRREGVDLVRTLQLGDVSGDDESQRRGRLGVFVSDLPTVAVPAGFGRAVAIGFTQTVYVTRRILEFLRDLVTLEVSASSVGSIGTIAVASGQAAQQGLDAYLQFMALFSVNLAILNMLPIPVLDGGHMIFLGLEAVRGQPLTIKQRLRWSQVGLLVVIGIMVWALGNDLLRFLGL